MSESTITCYLSDGTRHFTFTIRATEHASRLAPIVHREVYRAFRMFNTNTHELIEKVHKQKMFLSELCRCVDDEVRQNILNFLSEG